MRLQNKLLYFNRDVKLVETQERAFGSQCVEKPSWALMNFHGCVPSTCGFRVIKKSSHRHRGDVSTFY